MLRSAHSHNTAHLMALRTFWHAELLQLPGQRAQQVL